MGKTVRPPLFQSLLFKQAVFVSIVVIVTAASLSWLGYLAAKSTLQREIGRRLEIATANHGERIRTYLRHQEERIQLIASRTRFREFVADRLAGRVDQEWFAERGRRILEDAREAADGVLAIWLVDPEGQVLTSTDPAYLGADFSDDPDFVEGLTGPHLGSPRGGGKRQRLIVSAPVFAEEDELLGVVMILLDAEPLTKLLSEIESLGPYGQVLVGRFADEGRSAIRLLAPDKGRQAVLPSARVPPLAKAINGQRAHEVFRFDGRMMIGAYQPLTLPGAGAGPWGVVAMIPRDAAYAPLRDLKNWILRLDVSLLVLAVGVSFLLARRFVQPIRRLTDMAVAVAGGDFRPRARVGTADELGRLAAAFNEMTRKLSESYTELERRVRERTAELSEANAQLRREIAERERVERELAESRALYLSLVETLPVHLIRKDLEGRFTFANRAFCQLLGRSFDEIIGTTDYDYFPRELADKYRRDDRWVAETGRLFEDIEENVHGGAPRYFEVIKTPVRDPAGGVVGTQAIFWDVTDRKKAEMELQKAKAAAEAASRAKSDFLANISHEIRTPLNAVIGMTELVLDTDLNDSQREYLNMVQDSAESLLALINDILDFSKIEAGRLELERREFSLRDSVGDILKSLAFRAHSKGLELAWSVESDVPDRLMGDVGRLRQVLVNLVGNAIKFTERGEVVVRVERESAAAPEVVVHFCVADTGVGVPPDKLATIFDAFEQADTSATRRYGGAGLGLTISSRLVAAMGGRIWAESQPGEGSTFHFTARFGVAAEGPSLGDAQRAAIRGLRALVVDDNETNRRIVRDMLAEWEVEADEASSGEEALARLRQARRDGRPYAAVISDVQMPDMDGFALVERIRREADRDRAVIMMLTSGGRPDDFERCRRLGVAAHLIKPVKQSELLENLLEAIGAPAPPAERAGAAGGGELEGPSRPLRILLAEDSVANQKLAVGMLNRWGHHVVVASNGREALRLLETQEFDLILMDVQMPEMDGLEATALIRQRERHTGRRTPIIAMTARAMRGDREKCLAAGMDRYVAKPVRKKQLFEAIESVVRGGSEAPPRRKGGEAIDWRVALDNVDGDQELLREVVDAFLDECPTLLELLDRGLAEGDAAAVRRAAHTIKGSLRLFELEELTATAARLEELGRSGRLEQAPPLAEQLRRQLERLTPELRAFLERGGPP